jgi:hypothetical protein
VSRDVERDEVVFELGRTDTPAYLILSGSIIAARRDSVDGASVITTHGVGEVTGEISQLAGGPSLAEGRAVVMARKPLRKRVARARRVRILLRHWAWTLFSDWQPKIWLPLCRLVMSEPGWWCTSE